MSKDIKSMTGAELRAAFLDSTPRKPVTRKAIIDGAEVEVSGVYYGLEGPGKDRDLEEPITVRTVHLDN